MLPAAALLLAMALVGTPARAQSVDWTLSAFGTAAYSVSDREERFLRFIDKDGTFRSDSIIGAQLDGKLHSDWGQFGATVQVVGKPSEDKDTGLQPTLSWAFLSYRPNNEWLFRAGKYRPSTFLYLQNMEVGATYDVARLPPEVYAASPIYDLVGFSAAKSWQTKGGETTLEGFWGKNTTYFRYYDDTFNAPFFAKFNDNATGAVLSYQNDELLLRGSVIRAVVRPLDIDREALARSGLSANSGPCYTGSFEPTTVIPAPSPAGGTVYMPTDCTPTTHISFYSLGLDWNIDRNWRLIAEYVRRMDKSKVGLSSQGGYATVSRRIGDFTPYVTFARLISDESNRRIARELENTPVPILSGLPSSYHKTLASLDPIYDQWSIALGSSYSLSPNSKIKAEWMFSHVGQGSNMFDGEVSGMNANLFTISFSQSF